MFLWKKVGMLEQKEKFRGRQIMNKGLKRLLSIVLIFVMVIGMMPISGQITAEATVYSARTIYVYVGGNAEYQANAKEDNLLCYWFINNFDPNEPEFRGEHIMTKEADNIYSCKIPRNVETIQIHYKDANGWLQGRTQKYVITDDDTDTAYYGISPNQGDDGYYMWKHYGHNN